MAGQNRIRLIVQQQALPKYRIPVFRELASRPGIDLTLVYAAEEGIPNVEPEGFNAVFSPMAQKQVLGQSVYWHASQWDYAAAEHADVLVLPWNLRFISLIPSLLRARRNGVGTVLWGHGYSLGKSNWRAWALRKSSELGTSLLFYNHRMAERYQEDGVDASRIFAALNCLDQAPIQQARLRWTRNPGLLAAFKAEQKLDEGPVVLFVSRLHKANRVDLLLEAAAKLKADHPGLTVAIVGEGPEVNPLQWIANRIGLKDRVRFLGAIYHEDRLAPWFLAADVFCYPANIGLSMLHAMGYGVPVVTSDKMDVQGPEIEALEHGSNGLLYRDGDSRALALALREIIEDPERRMAMSRAALATATEQFMIRNMVDGIVAAVRYSYSRTRGS